MTPFQSSFATIRARIEGVWPFLLTAVVIVASVAGFQTDNIDQATKISTYMAGVTSAIAIIWLVAGFRIQASELSLQRQELHLQRLAAQQQACELRNSAKLGSLDQVRSLLEDAEKSVRESSLGIKSSIDLQKKVLDGMIHWENIEKSKFPAEVIDSYHKWLPAEAAAKNYVRYVASALKIYMEHHHPDHSIDTSGEAEDFVYIYQSWGHKAPYISHHIGIAALLAHLLHMFRTGLHRMRLAWLVASAKQFGKNILKDNALEEMREKIVARDSVLPAICDPWP